MKVTVDTRHDSLEEALATVHAAFGSKQDATGAENPRDRTGNTASGKARQAEPAQSSSRAVARPGTNRPRAKRASGTGFAAAPTKTSDRNGRKSTGSMAPAAKVAPPGQADAIRAWAKTQGMEVKQAGRLPAAVIQAYQARPGHR